MQTWYLQVQDSEYNVLLLNQEIGNYKKYNKWIEKKIDEIIFRQYPTAKRWEVRTNPYTSRVVMWQFSNWHIPPCGMVSEGLYYIHTKQITANEQTIHHLNILQRCIRWVLQLFCRYLWGSGETCRRLLSADWSGCGSWESGTAPLDFLLQTCYSTFVLKQFTKWLSLKTNTINFLQIMQRVW